DGDAKPIALAQTDLGTRSPAVVTPHVRFRVFAAEQRQPAGGRRELQLNWPARGPSDAACRQGVADGGRSTGTQQRTPRQSNARTHEEPPRSFAVPAAEGCSLPELKPGGVSASGAQLPRTSPAPRRGRSIKRGAEV